MGWNGAIEQERQALKRIVAMLFALAWLARRLNDMPRPIRHCVLWILRPAEALACEFIIGLARDFGLAPDLPASTFVHDGDAPTDAMRLSLRFRALAQLLGDVSRYVRRAPLERSWIKRVRHAIHHLLQALQGLTHTAQQQPDTS